MGKAAAKEGRSVFSIATMLSECWYKQAFMLWQLIEDLPLDWQNLASSELPPLVTVWNEQADRLRQSGEFQTFSEKLRREIAIETGIIERLYTIDRGITRLLIEQGINEALIPHGATDRPVNRWFPLLKTKKLRSKDYLIL